ncbi:MAG: hypothetical protein RMJ84_05955, partial [Sandaracinaceae bacterium]|nr:hypothetical protein [Sandaracinaceae bacterium]
RVEVPTHQSDFRATIRIRNRFGRGPGDFMLFAEGGLGVFSFTFDLDALAKVEKAAIIAPVEHGSLILGAGFEAGVVPEALWIGLYGQGRIGMWVGAATREVWGMQTAPANGLLAGLFVRHDANWVTRGVFIALRFEYFLYVTEFRGQVACYRQCDSSSALWESRGLWEPWPVEDPERPGSPVIGGLREPVNDHYFRSAVEVGYAFE